MTKIGGRPARILLVEDNPGDVRLVREALLAGGISHQLSVVGDGVAALDFLQLRGEHFAATRPDLVLLDLNLPRLDGRAVLQVVKADAALRPIPVVVFTTSSNQQDIAASYGLRANAVVTKPIDLDEFVAAVHAIGEFWFGAAALPAQG
jgi:CheY-like chemotaxis protein